MNDFYVNISQNIGIDCDTPVDENHPSIVKINENADVSQFEYKPITEIHVKKKKKKKQLVVAPIISRHIADIPNEMQRKEAFPTQLMQAQVTPTFKTDGLLKEITGQLAFYQPCQNI